MDSETDAWDNDTPARQTNATPQNPPRLDIDGLEARVLHRRPLAPPGIRTQPPEPGSPERRALGQRQRLPAPLSPGPRMQRAPRARKPGPTPQGDPGDSPALARGIHDLHFRAIGMPRSAPPLRGVAAASSEAGGAEDTARPGRRGSHSAPGVHDGGAGAGRSGRSGRPRRDPTAREQPRDTHEEVYEDPDEDEDDDGNGGLDGRISVLEERFFARGREGGAIPSGPGVPATRHAMNPAGSRQPSPLSSPGRGGSGLGATRLVGRRPASAPSEAAPAGRLRVEPTVPLVESREEGSGARPVGGSGEFPVAGAARRRQTRETLGSPAHLRGATGSSTWDVSIDSWNPSPDSTGRPSAPCGRTAMHPSPFSHPPPRCDVRPVSVMPPGPESRRLSGGRSP